MSPLKVNHDVITNYATSRKWVLHARKWVLDPKRHGVDVRDDVTTSKAMKAIRLSDMPLIRYFGALIILYANK